MAKKPSINGRNPDGTFAKGNTMTKGRQFGARHKTTVILEGIMSENAEKIVKIIIEQAKSGDLTAAKIVLDKIIPAAKDRPVQVNLPQINTTADVIAFLSKVTAEVACGALTPLEGRALSDIADRQTKAIELHQLELRISQLEENLKS